VLYGNVGERTGMVKDIRWNEKIALVVIVVVILVLGVYPQPMIEEAKQAVFDLLKETDISSMIKK
ncbi:MAG: hypothetical protein JNN29_10110, partial [Chitinophagaceae bacterium]|nr:hypothetical protein [Chitinophagaceae bacterium]